MRAIASTLPAGRALFGCVALSAILVFSASAQAATDCSAIKSAVESSDSSGFLAPIAEELAPARSVKSVGVDQAIARMQKQQCRSVASAAPPPAAQGGGNSFRFNMTQNGKRMTADEFDAWMKAQGVRVIKSPTANAAPPPAPPPPASGKKKKP